MSIDNSICWEKIKKTLSLKTVLIVLFIVTLASTVFYITIENNERKEIFIWYVTTETENCFSDDAVKLINDYGKERGIDKIVLTRRHPEDKYFDAVMSTGAYYNCDIFIMREDMINKYADTGMFLSLPTDGFDKNELFFDGENAVGISIDEDYYLLVNARGDVDLQMFFDIYNITIKK